VTLIEAVLYISVALALIVGGLVFYQQASVRSRTAAVVRIYSALIAEARIVSGEADYLSDTSFEDVINARGSIPPENWDATRPEGQRLRLPFLNMYASVGVDLSPGLGTRIFLQQHNMPVSLCSRLFAATLGSTNFANGAVFAEFRDENGAWVPADGGPRSHRYDLDPTLSPAGAATFCRYADLNGNGLVRTFIFLSTAD
jgi:hypothetical protein